LYPFVHDDRTPLSPVTGRTTCALDCPDRCAVLVETDDEGVRLRGDPAHPLTRGVLCRKIHRHPRRLSSPERIRHPWIRSEGRLGPFRPATWDEAMSAAVEALEDARAHDPASILLVRSAGAMGASKGLIDLVFDSLGARQPRGSLCDVAGIEAVMLDAGALRMNDPAEIERAETIVLWGKNPRASSIHTAAQVVDARRRGVPVLAVTPDASGLRGLADHVVSVRPGRDRFLALAVAKLLLPLVSPPWERTCDREAFEGLLGRLDLNDLLTMCDVSEGDARTLADAYAHSPRVATIVGWGVQRYAAGGETVRALHALSFLAGSLGQGGGGFYYSILSSGAFTPVGRSAHTAREEGSGSPPLLLPTLARGLASADPEVRVAWLTSTNIVNQGADAGLLRSEFEKIETVVAVEAFWTETARTATIILPPTLWLEEEDVVGSAWRGDVGAVRRVVHPPDGCRTDFEIALDLADRMGLELPCRSLDEWLALRLPGGASRLEEVRRRGWVDREGDSVAWRETSAHRDGLFRLVTELTPPSTPPDDRPLHLLTVIRGGAMHSQMDRAEQSRPLAVRMHPAACSLAGLFAGDRVRVIGPTGTIEGILEADDTLHRTAVACPRGGWVEFGQGVNLVTEGTSTDIGDGTAYYETTVRVEPV
jgi:anaerobic selenocysteine-containing dehydrogenase